MIFYLKFAACLSIVVNSLLVGIISIGSLLGFEDAITRSELRFECYTMLFLAAITWVLISILKKDTPND